MTEKKKRFFESLYEIFDREKGRQLQMYEIIDLLNEQDEKIKKLHRSIHISDELDKEKLEALKDAETETKLLNSYLVEKGLAEEYIRWKGDV